MKPPYSPAVIANNFLEKSGQESKILTPMQLLKLVYIAHGWNLAVTGEPLFKEPVQAWKYGPVVPSLFHEFKRYGGGPVTQAAHVPVERGDNLYPDFPELSFDSEAPFLPKDDEQTCKLLEWVWRAYGHLSGPELSTLTHKPNTPWSVTVNQMRAANPDTNDWTLNKVIENETIRKHYLDLWNKRNVR